MTDDATPVFERGDVVYGADPFKGEGNARPWLVLTNHEGRPFHGEQYVTLTLTTKTWMDDLIKIAEENWTHGGTPEESRIVPWSVQSIDREDIAFWQGRVEQDLVAEAIDAFVEELQ